MRMKLSWKHVRLATVLTVITAVPGALIYLFFSSAPSIKSDSIPVQGTSVNAPAIITLKPLENRTRFSSQTFKAKYQYNAIAPHWKESGASDDNRTVSVRTSQNGLSWGEWAKVEAMRPQKDGAPHSDEVFPEAPIITLGNYFQYRVDLSRPGTTAPAVRDMTITYIDSRPTTAQKITSALHSFLAPSVTASGTVPRIISRAEWGSPDPTGNAFHGTDQYWTPRYHPVEQVFIHHTVDSNYKSQTDGASLVRAVWQYHTYTLGWGDIGYNYLVDESGNTYQGRAHGDNIDAGHVYGYNSRSMGVALLGCFQPNDSACRQLNNSSTTGPSSPMLTSLTDLLAYKMTGYEIDPQAQHNFCKRDGSACLNLNTISGHRDAYPTSCPGDLAYADLQYIRDTTAAKKAQTYPYSAKQINFPAASLGDKSETTVTLQYKNTGTLTWHNTASGQANPIVLGTGNPTDHVSAFQGSTWLSPTRVANLNETDVAPGGTGTFTVTVKNPPGYQGEWYEYFRPLAEGLTDFGSFYGLPIVTRDYSYSVISQGAYTSSSKTTSIDLNNLSPGQTAWLTMKIRNTGNTTWSNSSSTPLNLGTANPRDRSSRFSTGTWINPSRPARLLEPSVAPGATGTFGWPIQVPSGPGTYLEYVTPLVEGVTWLNDTGLNYSMHVNGNYSWALEGQSAYTDAARTIPADMTKLNPGQKIYVGLSAKNTGDTVWYQGGSYPIRLGTDTPRDRASLFCDNTTWLGCNRPSSMVNALDVAKTSVTPGEIANFNFAYIAPGTGTYYEHFTPVVEGINWLNDIGLNYYTVVGSYSWTLASQAAYTDAGYTAPADLGNLHVGDVTYWRVRSKNTGTATWFNSGTYPLDLATTHPQDRSSSFCDASWLGCNRPARLKEASIAPGQIGTFEFKTVATKTGAYLEYFNPVAEYISFLNEVGMNFNIVVK